MATDDIEFQAIEALSRQSDYSGLCAQLLTSVRALAGAASARLLEAYDDRGYTSWYEPDLSHLVVREFPSLDGRDRPAWLADALSVSRQAAGPVSLQSFAMDIVCFGTLNGVWRFMEIEQLANRDTLERIRRLARVFANLMALIDRFERDPLTGLLNRQSFDHRFEEVVEYHRHNPRRKPASDQAWLAIADIDHFKRINDTHGHLFGDEILLLVSQLMRQSFRFDDLLFRYGGEEFIVILNNTDETGARQALERYREAVRSYEFPRIDALTISIGWTRIAAREFSVDVIHRADKALYHAKAHGRDRVVNFEETFSNPDAATAQ